MGRVRVSSEAVAGAASQTAQKAAEFEARVTAVQSLVSRTIGSGWSGAAANAFHEEFQRWLSGAGEVHDALNSLASTLQQSSGVYASTEQQLTAASDDSSARTVSKSYGALQ